MTTDFGVFDCVNVQLAKSKYTCQHAHTRIDFPDGVENMLQLLVTISIADNFGPYSNGHFTFCIEIPKTYPYNRM